MTALTIRINQQALTETQRANREADQREREAQVTDRYTKAIGQLGDIQLAIRLGGIYALERIAVDSERDHRTIVEVLSAFVRNSSQPAASNRSPDNQSGARPEEQPVPAAAPAGDTRQSPPTDVQAAVTVLGRLPSQDGVPRRDLTGARLRGANLIGAWLDGTNLTTAKNLTQQQLDSTRGIEDTKLPTGLRPAHWSAGPAANP